MFFPERRVLLLDASGLTVWRPQARQMIEERRFAANDPGLADFDEWLVHNRNRLLYFLVDLAEESFQAEEVPAVRGKDREQLIQRKLAQHFFATPYVLATSLGRLPDGRRDERLLLMALQGGAHLDPWLTRIGERNGMLAGLFSAPQMLERLLSPPSRESLLIITPSRAGLRQTFFQQGRLRFSRLTPLVSESADEAARAAAAEAAKIHQYLANQRLIERERALTIRLFVHPRELDLATRFCQDSPSLHFEFVSLVAEANRFGYAGDLDEGRLDPLLAYLLLRQPPNGQFAPAGLRRGYRLWQTRTAIQGAAVIVLVAATLFNGKQAIEILAREDAIARLEAQTAQNRRAHEALLARLPTVPLSANDLAAFVARFDELERRTVGPAPLLAQISRSFDAYPEIALERLEWSLVEETSQNPRAAPWPAGLPKGPVAEAILSCRLPLALARDRRRQLSLVNDFVGHLRRVEYGFAQVLTPPVDTESSKTLKSGDERRSPEAPHFVVRVSHPLQAP